MRRSNIDLRRDSASPQRQLEKRAAGAACRGGADSPPKRGTPGRTHDGAPAFERTEPERASPVHSPEARFSGRPAEAPRVDMASPHVIR